MKKRWLAILTAVLLLLLGAAALADEDTNKCGDSLFWSLDGKKLVITGSGEMFDYDAENPAPWAQSAGSVRTVELLDGLTYLGSEAFAGCAFSTVELPDGLFAIGKGTFRNCTALKSLTMPDGLILIGEEAFSGCKRLASVSTAYDLSYIGKDAFAGCTALKTLAVHSTQTEFSAILILDGNAALTGASKTFWKVTSVEPIRDPLIRYYVQGAEKPDLTGGVLLVSYQAPEGIAKVYLPMDAATADPISNSPGRHSATLRYEDARCSVTYTVLPTQLGENLTWEIVQNGKSLLRADGAILPAETFQLVITGSGRWTAEVQGIETADMARLTAVQLPAGLQNLPARAFYHCSSLTELEIPSSVTEIGAYALSECAVRQLALPQGLSSLGDYALADCTALTSVAIPGGITNIPTSLLSGCTALQSVSLPSGVTSIGDNAFRGCSSLAGIELPAGVTEIPSQAFFGCTALQSVTAGNLTSIGKWAFGQCKALTGITLPASLTVIDEGAFTGCDALSAVTLPQALQTIGRHAFQNCTSLAQIALPDSVTQYGIEIFSGCTALRSIVLPQSMTAIPPYLYAGSGIEACELPARITSIGRYAFAATQLRSITLPDAVAELPDHVFFDCAALTAVHGKNIARIGEGTFGGCTAIETVDLPALTESGIRAFADCTSLRQIRLPQLKAVPVSLFEGCTALAEIDLPAAETWAANALKGASGLTGFRFPAHAKQATGQMFADCKNLAWISLPHDLVFINENPQVLPDVLYYHGTAKQLAAHFDGRSAYWNAWAQENARTIENATLVVHALPEKTVYQTGEAFAPQGLSLSLVFADGHADPVANELVTVTGFDSSAAGAQTLTLSYYEAKPVTIPIEIVTKPLTGISVAKLPKTKYYRGYDALSTEGGTLRLTLEGGGTREVELLPQMVSGFDNSACGTFTLTVTYSGKTTSYTIEVEEAPGIRVAFPTDALPSGGSVYLDGIACPLTDGAITVPYGTTHGVLTEYTYNTGVEADPHTRYPTALRVWLLRTANGSLRIERTAALDNVLQYQGSSIRITGKKGIRMITAVPTDARKSLLAGTLAGLRLVEYGTIVAWNSALDGAALTMENKLAGNHAYQYDLKRKQTMADATFAKTGSRIQYTNVLTFDSMEKCKPDLAMRPYLIAADADGNLYTVYGGTIVRSIGYIAYQNRSAFKPRTASYAYIWEIIHAVYGDRYDAEYTK